MLDLNNVSSVVIVGGGTAGWISSLYMKSLFPMAEVITVESDKIPTIGVGEGTYRNFRHFLDKMNIDELEFIKETSSSLKLGIGYRGWKKDCGSYIHFFHDHLLTELSDIKVNGLEAAWPLLGFDGTHIPENSPYKNFVDANASIDEVIEYIRCYDDKVRYGYHFNADKVACFLKNIAIERGVVHKVATVEDVKISSNSNVEEIILDSSEVINSDLVVDCSGMRRVISSRMHGYKFIGNDHLMVNRGVGFFLPHDITGFSLLTEAIAMKHGWMWVIPTQERSGCGYVFSSNHCSEEDAKKEVEDYFGRQIDFPLSIKFEAGVVEKPFNRNVISLGLSAGFLEPLEATSIAQCISQLNDFEKSLVESGYCVSGRQIEKLNERTRNAFIETSKFIHLHYLGGRDDTQFWRDMHARAERNHGVNCVLRDLSHRLPRDVDSTLSLSIPQLYFSEFSYFSVYRSLGLITDDLIMKEAKRIDYNLISNISRCIKGKMASSVIV